MKIIAATKNFAATILTFATLTACNSDDSTSTSTVKAQPGLRGTVEIQNWVTNGVIDIAGVANHNGAHVHMWGATNAWNQRWELIEIGPGKYLIKSQGGRCLDVSNGDASDGARIQIWDCNGGEPNQHFWIDRVVERGGIVGYHIVNARTNKPISQNGGSVGQRGNREGFDQVVWKLNPK